MQIILKVSQNTIKKHSYNNFVRQTNVRNMFIFVLNPILSIKKHILKIVKKKSFAIIIILIVIVCLLLTTVHNFIKNCLNQTIILNNIRNRKIETIKKELNNIENNLNNEYCEYEKQLLLSQGIYNDQEEKYITSSWNKNINKAKRSALITKTEMNKNIITIYKNEITEKEQCIQIQDIELQTKTS